MKRVAERTCQFRTCRARSHDDEVQRFLFYQRWVAPGRLQPTRRVDVHLSLLSDAPGPVEQNDPLRGHSIALFTKLYGDHQSPEQAFLIDEPGKIPDFYRGADPQVSSFEQELWQNFWRLAEDKDYRKAKGVRVANGQGLWGPFAPDKLYTLTLDADGGLNLSSEPLKGIYREAMKQRVTKSE